METKVKDNTCGKGDEKGEIEETHVLIPTHP